MRDIYKKEKKNVMKIALIRKRFTPFGGAELFLDQLIDLLLKQGRKTNYLNNLKHILENRVHNFWAEYVLDIRNKQEGKFG